MGQIATRLTRPLRKFNIDNRTDRLFEKRQKVADAAPKHPTTVKMLSKIREEHPEYLEEQSTRHEILHENLKQVYVESKGDAPQLSANRSLPITRGGPEETELGAMETTHTIPEGRANLRSMLVALGQYQTKPSEVTAAIIAQELKLSQSNVENVLKYFKVLHLYVPKELLKESKTLAKAYKMQIEAAKTSATFFNPLIKSSTPVEAPGDKLAQPKT
ncbi:unnamed protein product [Lymnaea stagnalis]|uniref:NADH dehydrogenase [ubiquinone] 1 alpha subcomplex assembly factor 4 n=1 Tax=Lymnaea stagnalis TaxID=6523 RepID=A0AAV2I7B5_LYMST